MGQAEDPPTTEEWAMFVTTLGVLKMKSSEDLAHTSRHIQIFGMFISKCNRPCVTLGTPRPLHAEGLDPSLVPGVGQRRSEWPRRPHEKQK